MQKDFLNYKINSNSIFDTKDEKNFENVFSLVFGRYDNLEEEEEFQDKIYFYEKLLYYKNDNSSSEKKFKNQNLDLDLFNVNEGNKYIKNLKKQLITNKYIIDSINSDKKEESIIIINNMQQAEKSDISNNLKIRKKEKVKLKKNKSNYKRKAKTWIRGPYKKKAHIIIKSKIDDKYFPFTSGKGIINAFNDNSPKSDKDQTEKENPNLNLSNTTFLTNRYVKDSNGNMKKIKKQRKFKPDDIRKKIKSNCHKIIKNIINENLKKAGSEELFGFLHQSFMGNISRIFNKKYMDSTYEDLLSIDFSKNEKASNLDIAIKNHNKNINVLNYLNKNPEISKISGFSKLKKMKYKDILSSYFLSKEFENTIDVLKSKKETSEYISEYIFLAKDYINFFSN